MKLTLAGVLSFLEGAAATLSQLGVPTVSGAAGLADYFLKIAQAAVKAHEATTGKPLDLAQLHNIDPVS